LEVELVYGTIPLSCEGKPDFKAPVTYTLTLSDGSTMEYILTVKNAPLTRAELLCSRLQEEAHQNMAAPQFR
jgi:hypothetical protein